MAKWISDAHIDLILDAIKSSDEEVVLSATPSTYFNAIWPELWMQETAYEVGDTVRPPSGNGFIYECILTGSSGLLEPGWGVIQDQTFVDGSITWLSHENYSIANHPLSSGDIVKADGDIDGRKITIAQKIGVVTHTSGTVTDTALIEHATKTLHLVTNAETTLSGDNDVIAGRTTIFFEFSAVIRDPQ
jgi:hypothetical protein